MYDISEFCTDLTPMRAMQPDLPQLSLLRRQDENLFRKAVGLALIRLTETLNITNTLNTTQIANLTTKIGKTYYYLRFEELLYVFERGAGGKLGPSYNKLDTEIIEKWIEYYDVHERTDVAISLANSGHTFAKPLSDEELRDFYEKAGLVNQNPFVDTSHVRTNHKVASSDESYQAFRRQYLQQQMASSQPETTTQPAHDDASTHS